MMKSRSKKMTLLGTVALATTFYAGPVMAQVLDVVVVTAQKRESTLQDTAASISVIDGDIIDDRGVVAITEIFDVLPGVTFSEPPAGLPSPTIRGIGTSTANQAFEQSVGLFQDGIFRPRSSQYTSALFDVERIEVVRGGQGVIFGKNTSVGAISVVSRKPGDVFGGEFNASYEPVFGSYKVGATVDAPVSDELKFRFGGELQRVGGFVENLTSGEDDEEIDTFILRGISEFDPSGPFSGSVLAQYSERDVQGSRFQNVSIFDDATAQGTAALFGFPTPEPFERTVSLPLTFADGTTTPDEGNQTESLDLALTLGYDLGDGGQVTSITSYSQFDFNNVFDAFGTTQTTPVGAPLPPGFPFPAIPPLATITQIFDEDFSQFTQELRHNYEGDGFRLTSGAFFQLQDFEFVATVPITDLLIPFGPGVFGNATGTSQDFFDQDLWAASIFTQAGIDLTERLTLEAGLRVTREEKDGSLNDGNIINTLGFEPVNFVTNGPTTPGVTVLPLISPAVLVEEEINDTSIDWSVTLSADVTDDIIAFASGSQGTKSGGFTNSLSPGVPFTFPEEVAQAVELGLKGGFAEGRGYFSLTGFYTDIENFQDSVFDSTAGQFMTGAFVTVAFDADNYGLEAEGRYQLTDDLVIGGSAAYLEAESASGQTLARAPKLTTSWTADFDRNVTSDFALQLGGLVVTNSSQLHRQNPVPGAPPISTNETIQTGAYQLVDLYAGIRHEGTGIQLRAEVKNVTNEEYLTFGFPALAVAGPTSHGINGAFNRPRSVNLSLKVPFGGE